MLIDKLASGALRLDGHTPGTKRLTNWKKKGLKKTKTWGVKKAGFLTSLLTKLKPAVKTMPTASPESAIKFQTKLRRGLNNNGFRETGAQGESPDMFVAANKLEQLRRIQPQLANQYNDATASLFKSEADAAAQAQGFAKRAGDMWDSLLDIKAKALLGAVAGAVPGAIAGGGLSLIRNAKAGKKLKDPWGVAGRGALTGALLGGAMGGTVPIASELTNKFAPNSEGTMLPLILAGLAAGGAGLGTHYLMDAESKDRLYTSFIDDIKSLKPTFNQG